MNRKLVLIMALTLLVGMLSVAFNVQRAKASGTIYIRADGSIDPPDAPISTANNATYTFVGNFSDSIVVERDNIVVDGAKFTVQGGGGRIGIFLGGRSNVTIKNTTITGFEYGVWLQASSNNTISGNDIGNHEFMGICLSFSSRNNAVSCNNITYNEYGVHLSGSSANTIFGNSIKNNYEGIHLDYSDKLSRNTVSDNSVANNHIGIYLYFSNGNVVSGNNVTGNGYGILFSSSSNYNTFSENNVIGNLHGFHFHWFARLKPLGNTVYHNSFVNNTSQVTSSSEITWDGGYPSGGNYWSDYNGTDLFSGHDQNETGSDGIGDTEYTISANNTDNYPLMGMFSDFRATSEYHVQTICNSSIADFQFNGTAISFNVSGQNDTTGFCRICIPTALMNVANKVLINGTEVSYNLLPCSNETYSCLYFNYTHSTEEVVIIPEFPSFLILPLFMIVTLLVAIAHGRKHAKNQRENS